MDVQQMIQRLLAGQEQMMADRIADREHMKQMMARTEDKSQRDERGKRIWPS
jgi:hypothetical protein